MKPLGDPGVHLRLVRGMARVTGIDLVAAAAGGRLTQGDWAGLVHVCRGCGWAGDCAGWLSRTDAAPVAPPGCLNRARLEALRPQEGA